MIIRIVRMTFDPAKVELFLDIFNASQSSIRSMPGCLYLELWKDIDQPNVFITHSHWDSVEALNAYRKSELFGNVWKQTKSLFSEKPLAFSAANMSESD
jgi:quinol monooxygenase YgiN